MARTAGSDKTETHERIVRAAAKAIRRDGYADTTVGSVMKEAGLTHGGFYAHFDSREAMLLEALDFAATESIANLVGAAHVRAVAEGISPLQAMVEHYLSDKHLRANDAGCTIVACGSETKRQSPEVRHVATRHIQRLIAAIGAETPDALAKLSTMVGALLIAKIVDDPELADEVRAAARAAVLDQA